MMNWFYYLLEANLYLAVFYGVYRLLLHKETFYAANRFFLIGSSLLAFSLPLLQMGYLNQLFGRGIDEPATKIMDYTNSNDTDLQPLNLLLYTVYAGIAIFFSVKLIRDIYRIFALSKRSERYQKDKVTYVNLNQDNPAFSFFNLLFIPSAIAGKETILKHELVHIRQRHSLDIIFFEIIQILSWFNPITYLLKRDIKLLHEYIADEQTTLKEIGKYDYALFLIKHSFGMEANPLSNHIFNQSILKQRINMLNKEKSTGRARLKFLFALPIAAVMLGSSTMAFTKDYSLVDLYPEKSVSNTAEILKPLHFSTNQEPTKIKAPKTPAVPPAPPAAPPAPGIAPPPPPQEPIKKGKVKFPKPIVKKNVTRFPPPVIVPDAKENNKKFPPPIVTKDKEPVKKEAASSKPVYP